MRRAGLLVPIGLAVWALAGPASALRGELCFPTEGWAFISHWHVGSTAQSVREGWLRRVYNDRSWDRLKAGAWMPAAKHGVWIRQVFRYKKHLWQGFVMKPIDLPAGTRMYMNGEEMESLPIFGDYDLGPYLRSGTNVMILVYPPLEERSARVPEIAIRGIARKSGAARDLGSLRIWKYRRESVTSDISDKWLRSSDTTPWKMTSSQPPTSRDRWLPDFPYCLKAVIDVPIYWRGRELSVLFHGIPGRPDVYLNGEKLVEALACPARVDLGETMKFSGHDTLCLVYDSLPAGSSGRDSGWAVAAIHWEPSVRLPLFSRDSTFRIEAGNVARQEGLRRSVEYAAEILAVSATPFELSWEWGSADGGAVYGPYVEDLSAGETCLAAAFWPATPFKEADRSAVVKAAEEWCGRVRESYPGRIWLVSPPTVGTKHQSIANTRLKTHGRELAAVASGLGVRTIPFNDMCRSALRDQRREPTRTSFSEESCVLTPHGSYLLALAILETLSLP